MFIVAPSGIISRILRNGYHGGVKISNKKLDQWTFTYRFRSQHKTAFGKCHTPAETPIYTLFSVIKVIQRKSSSKTLINYIMPKLENLGIHRLEGTNDNNGANMFPFQILKSFSGFPRLFYAERKWLTKEGKALAQGATNKALDVVPFKTLQRASLYNETSIIFSCDSSNPFLFK